MQTPIEHATAINLEQTGIEKKTEALAKRVDACQQFHSIRQEYRAVYAKETGRKRSKTAADEAMAIRLGTVSYTHLTLPTKA